VAYRSSHPFRHRKKDGTVIEVDVSANAIVFEGKEAWLLLATDVTEKRSLEAQLFQSQKMESMGRLAGGVAHDFNNLLGVISGYGELLHKRVRGDPRLRRYAEDIVKAAQRAAGLTGQLLAFSRRQVLQPKVLDLNSVVGETETMLRRVIGEDVQLVTVFDDRLGAVKADPGQMEQVLMNLAVNARDAMPKGGRLTIETGNVQLDRTYAQQHPGVAPGRYVMLAVSDTGHGIAPEVKARIFEPFFTTKEPGRGTGLGLATVHGIVKQSDGHVWVYSEPGHGTTFKIYLPAADEVAAEDAADAVEPELPRGSETVLLVEDEGSLRELVRECLEALGYTILEARHGAEALTVCEGHADDIHVLMTDVVMPGMSGRELGERLRALRPELRVLYMSGYTDDAVVLHGVLAEKMAFLQKPFTEQALARKLREVLDAPGH
jgi:signal transduction histidine kinase